MSIRATIATTKVVAEVNGSGYAATLTTTPILADIGGSAIAYTSNDTVTRQNSSGGTISAGMAVALHTDGNAFVKADASLSTKPCFGILTETVADGFSGAIRVEGYHTHSDWTAATGAATLTPNAVYYVSYTTAGMLTTSAPTTGYMQAVGRAISATTLDISIERPIKRN